MRILYFDCFNGASGDMLLGALIDAGLPLGSLKEALGSLGIEEYELSADRVLRAGVSSTKFRLHERVPQVASAHARGGHAHAHEAASDAAAGHAERTHDHGHGQTAGHHHHEGGATHEHRHDHDHGDHRHGDHGHEHHAHRSLGEILALIDQSALSDAAKARASALFRRLAEAEARIHQMPVDRVHLHEVGALDSIIDIVGAVFAIEWFGADRIVVSPINVGGGMVRSAHGVFPVPAPATVQLLGDAPIYSHGPRAELLTPTGALLLTAHASSFGPIPSMRVERTGYGAGERDFADTPNVLRVLVGEGAQPAITERLIVAECEIDDMNPQIFGVLMDQLYAAGALEVFYQPVQMKKNRPGTLVTLLVAPERREALVDIVFRETTTIGVRFHEVERERLQREIVPVETPVGTIRFKIASRGGRVLNAAPEFDDCARIAGERGLPVKDVQAAATHAWLQRPDRA
jgi:uncharacterized protein (TIGR00299 family) protein